MNEIIKQVESGYKRTDIPSFRAGDRLRVHLRIKEGKNERIQVFEGDVIAIRGEGLSENFTIRKTSGGIGVEKILPLHSPSIDNIELVRRGRVRRAKLYYLRKKIGKKARITELLDHKN